MQMASIGTFLAIYWYFIYKIHHRIYILDVTFQDVYASAKFKIFLLCKLNRAGPFDVKAC